MDSNIEQPRSCWCCLPFCHNSAIQNTPFNWYLNQIRDLFDVLRSQQTICVSTEPCGTLFSYAIVRRQLEVCASACDLGDLTNCSNISCHWKRWNSLVEPLANILFDRIDWHRQTVPFVIDPDICFGSCAAEPLPKQWHETSRPNKCAK